MGRGGREVALKEGDVPCDDDTAIEVVLVGAGRHVDAVALDAVGEGVAHHVASKRRVIELAAQCFDDVGEGFAAEDAKGRAVGRRAKEKFAWRLVLAGDGRTVAYVRD